MEPLTRPDEKREWIQCFTPVDDSVFEGTRDGALECYLWVIQFRRQNWKNLLEILEHLAWPEPHSVQVLVHDEDDDCFGLWMIYEGRLTEVPLPNTERQPFSDTVTGILTRTDRHKKD